jgi:hypothetical protein
MCKIGKRNRNIDNKMKNKNYHTVGTFPKTNRKKAKSIPPTHKYITALFHFNKIGDFKLVLWVQTASTIVLGDI